MISQLKTALLGVEPRTESISAEPDVAQIDPFRPGPYLVDTEQDPVTMDQIFDSLGNQRRRYVLKYMSTIDGTASMSDLADRITAWECEKEEGEITSKERKRVYVSLYQGHLPKLADAGAISYDKQEGEVDKGEKFDHFAHYLRNE